jgi:hypothetical protein
MDSHDPVFFKPNAKFLTSIRNFKDNKIPTEYQKRVDILHQVIPYLTMYVHEDTIQELKSLEFVSSRALAEILRLCSQVSEIGVTVSNIKSYIKDTVDDEVRNIAIAASKKTAQDIFKKFGYSTRCMDKAKDSHHEKRSTRDESEDSIDDRQTDSEECTDEETNGTEASSSSDMEDR